MAEAREKSEWSRMSALLALTANAHRDPKKSKGFKPDDFNPYAERQASAGGVGELRRLFTGMRGAAGANPQGGADGSTAVPEVRARDRAD